MPKVIKDSQYWKVYNKKRTEYLRLKQQEYRSQKRIKMEQTNQVDSNLTSTLEDIKMEINKMIKQREVVAEKYLKEINQLKKVTNLLEKWKSHQLKI